MVSPDFPDLARFGRFGQISAPRFQQISDLQISDLDARHHFHSPIANLSLLKRRYDNGK
jgi:hypothetical protein